jgi:RimJ/RimL family protein N-acetyltransferase
MLETARLRLVPLGAEHFDALAAMYADPEVARFLDGAPLDRDEAWRRLALHVGHWALRGYGGFAAVEKSSGATVGRCGPWFPEGWPALEIGYSFLREFWGRGYATEAAIACARHAYQSLRAPEVISLVSSDNLRSQRVAERGGAKLEREIVLRGRPLRVFLWPRP